MHIRASFWVVRFWSCRVMTALGILVSIRLTKHLHGSFEKFCSALAKVLILIASNWRLMLQGWQTWRLQQWVWGWPGTWCPECKRNISTLQQERNVLHKSWDDCKENEWDITSYLMFYARQNQNQQVACGAVKRCMISLTPARSTPGMVVQKV